MAYELNREGARLARRAGDEARAKTAASASSPARIGPTNRTASISPDVNNPGFRAVTFDELRPAYPSRSRGLIDGGADIILIETIFDTLNAKAAIFAIEEAFDEARPAPAGDDLRHDHRSFRAARCRARRRPPSGIRVRHAKPFADRPQLRARRAARCARISPRSGRVADTLVCAYPNAGLPNEFGLYDESPE